MTARRWSAVAVVVICLALTLAPQVLIGAEQSSGSPVITASPEHVTVTDGSGSTEIEWDTGNGSMGFVFVTEDAGKPVLFANSSRGNQVVPWIGKHSYVFELCGDDQRQTLLARVTVSGSGERSAGGPGGPAAVR